MSRLSRSLIPRGLRARITLLATLLAAAISLLLLWLAWRLVSQSVAAVPNLPPGTTVVVDNSTIDADMLTEHLRDEARRQVLVVGAVAFCCVVAAAGVVAWTLTSRVLRPLREVTDTASRLSAESLDKRIGYRVDTAQAKGELADLTRTFDSMLERLQHAFDAQHHFVANASHELRTPLSVIRTELDVTLSDEDADVAELRRMAGVVRDATERAERLVRSLLLLARTDAAGLTVFETIDLADVVERAWQAARDQADNRDLRVSVETPQAFAAGDPALLERVAGNLLENAIKHNVDGGWIEVGTRAEEQVSVLTVRSSGPLVDSDTVAGLFEPFRRAGTARTARSGAGLGLSIVRAAVDVHDGTVGAEPVVGGGLSVRVRLPNG